MKNDAIQLFTIPEASKRLRMSRGFLYGLSPATPGLFRIGKSVRVDLARFLEGLRERIDSNKSSRPAA